MQDFIATFHTHLAALRTHRAMKAVGIDAQMAPVPRSLSSSCGTCVRYRAADVMSDLLDMDCEEVVKVLGKEQYERVEQA